jgi:osmotically-inducible protein OsmY
MHLKSRVYVEGEVVTLAGVAEDAQEARAMGNIVQNISGVSKVIDHLYVRRGA